MQTQFSYAMGRYSLDLRQKVVTAYQLGNAARKQLAEQFMLSPATVHSYAVIVLIK